MATFTTPPEDPQPVQKEQVREWPPAPDMGPRRSWRRRRGRRRQRIWGHLVRAAIIIVLALIFLLMWESVAFAQGSEAQSTSTQNGGAGENSRKGAFAWELPGGNAQNSNQPNSNQQNSNQQAGSQPTSRGQGQPPSPNSTPPSVETETQQRTTGGSNATAEVPVAPPRGPENLDFGSWLRGRLAEEEAKNRSQQTSAANERQSGAVSAGNPAAGQLPQPPVGTSQPVSAPSASPPAMVQRPSSQESRTPATPPPFSPPELIGNQIEKAAWMEKADSARPIGRVENEELSFTSTLDLILALEKELQFVGDGVPRHDLQTLRFDLYHHLIDLSVQVGFTDNPRDNLDAIRSYLRHVLRVEAVARDHADLALITPARVLREHRASPVGWSLLALAFAEKLNSYLDLEPVTSGGLLALRYRSGAHRYLLVPLYPDRLYDDREFVQLAHTGKVAPAPATMATSKPQEPAEIKVLTRKQLWGVVFGEIGDALLHLEGETARGSDWIDRGLDLYFEQARAHVARATVLLKRNDREAARESLDTAVRLEPNNLSARLRRVELLAEVGDYDRLVDDLRFLSQSGKHPRAGIRLTRVFLQHEKYFAAQKELERLQRAELPPSLVSELDLLTREVIAAPWVAVLRGAGSDGERFQAVDRLQQHRLPMVLSALVDTLDDTNLRLSRYAWQALKKMTGLEHPPIAQHWRRSLELPAPTKSSP